MTYEYKGYKLTQAKINNHFTIFNKNGEMVMHAQYDKPLTHERAVELIERFVSTYGNLKVSWM